MDQPFSLTGNHNAYRLADGWYCMVAFKQFGPWPDRGSARAGYETEMRRAQQKVQNEHA